jgi:hypothetical protein
MGAMSFLKTMFPFISAAASLGGPLGTMAANAVGKALGVDKVDASPNGIESAITKAGASPEQIAAMQKAEQDFQVEMQKLGFEHCPSSHCPKICFCSTSLIGLPAIVL